MWPPLIGWVFALSREVEGNTRTTGGWELQASGAAQSALSGGHDNGSELAGTLQRGGESTDAWSGPGYDTQQTGTPGSHAATFWPTRGVEGTVSVVLTT